MDDTTKFHQTPVLLAKDLIKFINFEDEDIVLEPFAGMNAFYNEFPNNVIKYRTELTQGSNYIDFDYENISIDWVITNPPFRLETDDGKRENAFYKILKFYSTKVKKGIVLLGNDKCISSLTPKRMKEINDDGIFLNKIITCNVKAWRGRYYALYFYKNKPNDNFSYLMNSY
tara:strand:- start:760 stop:1275 length:516 start_codon:yes stop_codon:yes gene_type:complete